MPCSRAFSTAAQYLFALDWRSLLPYHIMKNMDEFQTKPIAAAVMNVSRNPWALIQGVILPKVSYASLDYSTPWLKHTRS